MVGKNQKKKKCQESGIVQRTVIKQEKGRQQWDVYKRKEEENGDGPDLQLKEDMQNYCSEIQLTGGMGFMGCVY